MLCCSNRRPETARRLLRMPFALDRDVRTIPRDDDKRRGEVHLPQRALTRRTERPVAQGGTVRPVLKLVPEVRTSSKSRIKAVPRQASASMLAKDACVYLRVALHPRHLSCSFYGDDRRRNQRHRQTVTRCDRSEAATQGVGGAPYTCSRKFQVGYAISHRSWQHAAVDSSFSAFASRGVPVCHMAAMRAPACASSNATNKPFDKAPCLTIQDETHVLSSTSDPLQSSRGCS
jgi:hypothetical protein